MDKFTHSKTDSWVWQRARPQDVPAMVNLTDQYYGDEVDHVIFKKNPTRFHYHLHRAILDQVYGVNQQLLNVAVKDSRIIAWSWIERGKYTPYADEEFATAEFVHIDLNLPARDRVRLTYQIIEQWQGWCRLHEIPVLCSTTIRNDQEGFMRIHERMGFVRRGSFAYKRIGE
jgi:hypothetical protein